MPHRLSTGFFNWRIPWPAFQRIGRFDSLDVEINGWNRFAISFQYPVGDYQPGSLQTLRTAAT
jgi:hypothetical protein